ASNHRSAQKDGRCNQCLRRRPSAADNRRPQTCSNRLRNACRKCASQSCVLLAGLRAAGRTTVREKIATRDHTELALRAFGAQIEQTNGQVSIEGNQKLHAIEAYVPGDLSTATFFLCATAMLPDSSIIFDHVLLNPTRAGVL